VGAKSTMTPTPESRLLELYDRVADAPGAIDRLRKFVLDLAVRGKLVEQNPEDEPAEALLERIAAEKARMVKAGEIRKPRDLGNSSDLVSPFQIPETWRWCRLDTVGAIIGGGTPAAADVDNFAEPGAGIPWLTPADLGGYRGLFIERGGRDLTEQGLNSSSATMMPSGTVLFTSRAPIGYVAIAANPISTNQGFKSIVPYVSDCSRFIALTMRAFAADIDGKAPGTTFKEVSGKIVAGVAFPLPPLPEQHRIVAKVDELMALLDRLETTRTQQETTRDRLTTASLARLTAPHTTEKEFRAAARFTFNNLDQLTSRLEQIKLLRQTILDLAVRGKLVEQDPADEPVLAHLMNLDEETAKTREQLEPLDPSGFGIELPQSWVWLPLGAVIRGMDAGWSPQCESHPRSDENEWGVLKTTAVQALSFDPMQHKLLPKKLKPRPEFQVEVGDILVTRAGPKNRVGVSCVVDMSSPSLMISDKLIRFHALGELSPRYIALTLNAGYTFSQIEAAKSGMAVMQMNISQSKLRAIPIPFPPLAEQRLIVTKVDALMALCDQLESTLSTADDTRTRLLEVLLQKGLQGVAHNREAA